MSSIEAPKSSADTLSSPERVRRHIMEHFIESGASAGTRLPPVREIAQLLNVSSTTVDRAYKQLIKEKKIETGVGRGTFVAGKAKPASRRYCFALNHVPNMGESHGPFYLRINSSILSAAARLGRRTVIQPFAAELNDWRQAVDALMEERESVDGLILSRFQSADLVTFEEVIRAYEESGRPVITIHPPDFSTTKNFVSTDFLNTSRRLGRALGESGRRKILFIIYHSLAHSSSNLPRLSGLQAGLADIGLNPLEVVSLAIADNITAEAGYEAMKQQIAAGNTPDAVYCFGDYLAVGAVKALEEAGLTVPRDASVIGGTGLDVSANGRTLSRLLQPFELLGEEIIRMLISRVENGNQDLPGEYIDTTFFCGETTTPEENRLIKKHEPAGLALRTL